MPTLFRFLTIIGILAALVFAAMFALATFVTPRQTEMTVDIPLDRLNTKPSP
ncbi:histidine kinase [Mesorhizobium sp. IMUNJ 23232]|uniref:histidine kinase n=1 Tax=Mesorhizobium sp. IMUNJ 23232 TaxID=3376064 RepID=UPI0037B82AF7